MTPYTAFSRINLDQLYLPFLEELFRLVSALKDMGAVFEATSGYRDFAAQRVLWCKGRTQSGEIVTNAGPGDSAHNYGLAVDFVRVIDNKADWQAVDYDVLGDQAERHGLHLTWGGDWDHPNWNGFKDRPHIQWPGYVTREQLAPLKAIYLAHPDAPLTAVWEHLNAAQPKEQVA